MQQRGAGFDELSIAEMQATSRPHDDMDSQPGDRKSANTPAPLQEDAERSKSLGEPAARPRDAQYNQDALSQMKPVMAGVDDVINPNASHDLRHGRGSMIAVDEAKVVGERHPRQPLAVPTAPPAPGSPSLKKRNVMVPARSVADPVLPSITVGASDESAPNSRVRQDDALLAGAMSRDQEPERHIAMEVVGLEHSIESESVTMPSRINAADERYEENVAEYRPGAAGKPLSRRSEDASASAYALVRESLNQDNLPPPAAVDLGALVNHFDYGYAELQGHVLNIETAVAPSPFSSRRQLLKIGMTGMAAIASGVTVELEFNPEIVSSFRQIGSDKAQRSVEIVRTKVVTGDRFTGQSLTILYEVQMRPRLDDDMMIVGRPQRDRLIATIRARFRDADREQDDEVTKVVMTSSIRPRFEDADVRFRLAACVAAFAERLRETGNSTDQGFQRIMDILRPIAAELPHDADVQDLLELVDRAAGLQL